MGRVGRGAVNRSDTLTNWFWSTRSRFHKHGDKVTAGGNASLASVNRIADLRREFVKVVAILESDSRP